MGVEEINLRTVEFAAVDAAVTLTLSSTCTVDLPSNPYIAPGEFPKLVKAGHLWIGHSGKCRLQVQATANGKPLLPPIGANSRLAKSVIQAVASCPLWTELNLILTDDETRPPSDRNLYSVAHPSGLVNVPQIPHGSFRSLSCHLDFAFKDQALDEEAPNVSVRRPKKLPKRATRQAGFHHKDITISDAEFEPRCLALIEPALREFVGLKRRARGARPVRLTQAPSLLEIAPAVWNSRFMRTIAGWLPWVRIIANILAGLLTAQSPSLRRKMEALSLVDADSDSGTLAAGDARQVREPDVEQIIERRLWRLILQRIPGDSGIDSFRRQKPKADNSQNSPLPQDEDQGDEPRFRPQSPGLSPDPSPDQMEAGDDASTQENNQASLRDNQGDDGLDVGARGHDLVPLFLPASRPVRVGHRSATPTAESWEEIHSPARGYGEDSRPLTSPDAAHGHHGVHDGNNRGRTGHPDDEHNHAQAGQGSGSQGAQFEATTHFAQDDGSQHRSQDFPAPIPCPDCGEVHPEAVFDSPAGGILYGDGQHHDGWFDPFGGGAVSYVPQFDYHN